MEIKIEFSDRAHKAFDNVLLQLERIGQELHEIRSLVGKQFIPGEVCEFVDSRAADTSPHYRVNLITYKSYTFGTFEIVTKEMTDWLAKHNKKPSDIMWATCTEIGDMRFVGQIKDIILSGKEIESYATKDNFILNICGHPWYIGSKLEPVNVGG